MPLFISYNDYAGIIRKELSQIIVIKKWVNAAMQWKLGVVPGLVQV